MSSLTLLERDRSHEIPASIRGGEVRIPAAALRDALGWELKPEGLCRGEICVPVRDPGALANDDGIDLAAFAEATGQPLALDAVAGAGAIGTPLADRAAELASLAAPDFSLPDLDGNLHALSEHRGKKVLLIAYASW